MDQILSYRDKYLGNGTKGTKGIKSSKTAAVKGNKNNLGGTMGSDNSNPTLELPAKINAEQKKTIQELAIKTFQALGCNGVIRIDFIINQDNGKIFVNEVNTIPGCLSFHLWRETGMDYTEELNEIISLGLKRAREEKNLTFSFETNILANFNGTKAQKLHE